MLQNITNLPIFFSFPSQTLQSTKNVLLASAWSWPEALAHFQTFGSLPLQLLWRSWHWIAVVAPLLLWPLEWTQKSRPIPYKRSRACLGCFSRSEGQRGQVHWAGTGYLLWKYWWWTDKKGRCSEVLDVVVVLARSGWSGWSGSGWKHLFWFVEQTGSGNLVLETGILKDLGMPMMALHSLVESKRKPVGPSATNVPVSLWILW